MRARGGLRGGLLLVAALAGVLAPVAGAAQAAAQAASTHVLIVSGLGGEPRWRDEFHAWGQSFAEAAVKRHGVAEGNLVWLAERADRDPRIRARSTAENVGLAFADIARRAGPNDDVFVLLIGHGSFDAGESKLNLPGPSPSAGDFARWLTPFTTQRVSVVNTSSASGGFIAALAGPRRAIVTATRSGQERNEAVFGRFFVRAFADDVADVDKDGRVSLLEAFEYARTEVDRFYASQNRLKTEHASFDDTGAGAPLDAAVAGGAGTLAASLFLGGGAAGAAAAAASPELRALLEARDRLNREIAALRAARATMDAARYEAELERLLVDLALTSRRIRELEAGQ
jgi:hypothetical protein